MLVCRDLIEVMSTIQFHNQPMLETAKIHDKWPERLLAAKLHSSKLTTPEASP